MSATDTYIEDTLRRIESRLNYIDLLTDRIDVCTSRALPAVSPVAPESQADEGGA